MKKKVFGAFLAGIILGAVVFGPSITYALSSANITVDFLPLKYYLNGVQKEPPADQQGFIYNGYTYVPLRFISEAMGLSVDWNQDNSSISITGSFGPQTQQNKPTSANTQYMSDNLKPYFFNAASVKYNEEVQIAGQKYTKSYCIYPQNLENSVMSFNLEGKYSSIKGTIGLDDRFNKKDTKVRVIGDDKLLEVYRLLAGSLPQNMELNVTGVTKLTFEFENDIVNPSSVILANVLID